MEIKEALIKSVTEVFPLYKIKPQFKFEEENDLFSSVDQVNVLNSFSHNLQGNIIFGFSRNQILKIATIVNGIKVLSLNEDAKNIIGEIVTLIVNLAISKFKAVNSIYISPPVLITGDNAFSMISRTKTTKLVFQLNDDSELLTVTFCIEKSGESIL